MEQHWIIRNITSLGICLLKNELLISLRIFINKCNRQSRLKTIQPNHCSKGFDMSGNSPILSTPLASGNLKPY
jgi:hypothetical protein